MANILVRNIPDDLKAEVVALAHEEHRSLNEEIVAIVRHAVEEAKLLRQRQEAIARIKGLRARIGSAPADTLALIREDRAR